MQSNTRLDSDYSTSRQDFLRANMDVTINPGDDFFTYANGAWLKAHPIPASEAGWGIGNVVREELYVNLRKINEDSLKPTPLRELISRRSATSG